MEKEAFIWGKIEEEKYGFITSRALGRTECYIIEIIGQCMLVSSSENYLRGTSQQELSMVIKSSNEMDEN
eukprot:scaffold28446_cov82-Cyclotella_meneghiniana.AAC.1